MANLITLQEVADRLSISRQNLRKILPKLLAKGLRRCKLFTNSTRWRYDSDSLDKIINESLERENPITDVVPLVIIGQGASRKEIMSEDM